MEQQIKKYQTGEEVVADEDPFSGGIDLSQIDPTALMLLMAQNKAAAKTTPQAFESNVERYQQRLAPFSYQAPRKDIFDLASSLGAGILASQQRGGRNPFVGIGEGFVGLSQQLRKDEEDNAKNRQAMGLQAFQLALKDEQQANDYMNQINLKLIDNANKEQEYVRIEYDEVDADTGETVSRAQSFANIPRNYADIKSLMDNNNGREVKLADTQINMPNPMDGYGDRKAVDTISEQSQQFSAEAQASNAVIDQVNQAYILANQIVQEGGIFGPYAKSTLGIREFVSSLGYGDLLKAETAIAPQKALNQLAMSFTMAIVSQTKGAISNREMELFIAASPTLGSTAEGFMEQLRLLEKLALRKKDFYSDYLTEMEALEADESLKPKQREIKLQRFTNDWSEANPLLSEEDEAILQNAIDNPTIDSSFTPRAFRRAWEQKEAELKMIPLVTSKAEYDALPSGAHYRNSSGQTAQKP
tara:strand:- start:4767 stop:6185 length:1419 start_codon:yes stop_codon:yes gene_type:complete